MALIKCSECGRDVSENAAACPHCGEPAKQRSRAPEERKSAEKIVKKKSHAGALLLLLAAVIVLAGIVYKNYMSPEEKAGVNQAVTSAGLSAILPWTERAEASVRDVVNNSNIASVVIGYAHPTGRDAALERLEVGSSGNTVHAVLYLGYSGGIFRKHYSVVVKWSFAENTNLGVQILQDTSMMPILGMQMRRIENTFQADLYPKVISNIK
jgi:hypothetical protein